MKQISASITSKTELSPGILYYTLHTSETILDARPGQFVMVDCGQDFILRRPLSINDVLNGNQICLLIKNTGKGTSRLASYQKGDSLDIIGPLGNGFNIDENAENILIIAGGIGIAPLVFLTHSAVKKKKRVTLLMGTTTGAQIYPDKLLPDGISTIITTEDGSRGKKGLVTDVVPEFLDKCNQVFACGPLKMYKSLLNIIKSNNCPKNVQVSLELRMGCGFGVCYGCTIKTENGIKQVCRDGPVFDIREVMWDWIKI